MATKPKPDEFYVCLWSFAGHDLSVREGAHFRGDHEIVRRFPDRFVPADTPGDELHRLRAAAAAFPPEPELLGSVKLRVLPGQGGSLLDGGSPRKRSRGRGVVPSLARRCPQAPTGTKLWRLLSGGQEEFGL